MKRDQDEKDKKETKLQQNDISGSVYVKAEWKNNGPQMPPIKSENLFKKPAKVKNRREYTSDDERLMLFK